MRTGGALAGAAAAILAAAAPASAQEAPRTHRVLIEDFAFSPAVITVRPGDTIEWINADLAPHTATALDGAWDTGHLATGRVGTAIAAGEGTVAYHCAYHTHMGGTVVVEGSGR